MNRVNKFLRLEIKIKIKKLKHNNQILTQNN